MKPRTSFLLWFFCLQSMVTAYSSDDKQTPVVEPRDVVALFKRQAAAKLQTLPLNPRRLQLKNFLKDEIPFTATREKCSKALARMTGTLNKKEINHRIILGTQRSLRNAIDCWSVESAGRMGGFIGYLNANLPTYPILLIWQIPEG